MAAELRRSGYEVVDEGPIRPESAIVTLVAERRGDGVGGLTPVAASTRCVRRAPAAAYAATFRQDSAQSRRTSAQT